MRKFAGAALTVGIIALIPTVISGITFWQGHDVITDLAVENEWCSADGCTANELSILFSTLIEETHFSNRREIVWCLGVEDWANVHVRKGSFLIGPIMWLGGLACPGE